MIWGMPQIKNPWKHWVCKDLLLFDMLSGGELGSWTFPWISLLVSVSNFQSLQVSVKSLFKLLPFSHFLYFSAMLRYKFIQLFSFINYALRFSFTEFIDNPVNWQNSSTVTSWCCGFIKCSLIFLMRLRPYLSLLPVTSWMSLG